MKNWNDVIVNKNTSLRDAMVRIDSAGCQIALVVEENGRLLGTLSDGDARRGLLRGLTLSDSVAAAMNNAPIVARDTDNSSSILNAMRKHGLHQIPIVNVDNIVIGLTLIDEVLHAPERLNWVVIMAGGLGSRLKHLTKHTPKPMLEVGSRPLLETIISNYSSCGFNRFYLSVNYKAEVIEQYFGDGEKFGVEIKYLREKKRLGTAGPLGLIPEAPDQPIIIANGDLLTKADVGNMLDEHVANDSALTMAVREYEMQVPFGVVHGKNNVIVGFEEKPIHRFLVNAGIYVLSPNVLPLVPVNTFFDMPQLVDAVRKQKMVSRMHQIDGYWLDIGRLADYERANIEFNEVFL